MTEPRRKHGAYALKAQGARALDRKGKRGLRTQRRELLQPGGVREALATRAALALAMVGVLEGYIAREVEAGTELADIPVVRVWPAYQNAAGRALKALEAAKAEPEPPLNVADVIARAMKEAKSE